MLTHCLALPSPPQIGQLDNLLKRAYAIQVNEGVSDAVKLKNRVLKETGTSSAPVRGGQRPPRASPATPAPETSALTSPPTNFSAGPQGVTPSPGGTRPSSPYLNMNSDFRSPSGTRAPSPQPISAFGSRPPSPGGSHASKFQLPPQQPQQWKSHILRRIDPSSPVYASPEAPVETTPSATPSAHVPQYM
jgi:hypothetical protein